MTVNSHLQNVANAAILRDLQKESVRTSVSYLSTNLRQYFGTEIGEQKIFGSYSRNTILPRAMDLNSDVDYMIVFEDGSFRPQTYLDKIRRFTEFYYSSSQIGQSNPTIQLELNHIKFDLVPALVDWYGTITIPAKAAAFFNWVETNPTDANQSLIDRNQQNSNLTKPLVRIMKYWNARAGCPFEPFELEKLVVAYSPPLFMSYTNLAIYFYDFVESIQYGWGWPQRKTDKVTSLKSQVLQARNDETNYNEMRAEMKMKRLFPLS